MTPPPSVTRSVQSSGPTQSAPRDPTGWRGWLRVGATAFGGLLVGFWVMVGIYVLEARFGRYIFALHDLAELRPEIAPPLLGLAFGTWLGLKPPPGLGRVLLTSAVGGVLGTGLGAWVGGLVWDVAEGAWAGGIVGSALGLVVGFLVAWLRALGRRAAPSAASAAALLIATAACGPGALPELPDSEPVPLPDPADVDAVVFLIGDAGAAAENRSPILQALREDIERWSEALGRDSAVSVLYLGDLVYPVGVRDRDHRSFPVDSVRLWNQIAVLAGPSARGHHAEGLFLAGNHDWGNRSGELGIERLRNLEEQLAFAREDGVAASLLPAAGLPGPVIRDLGNSLRFVLLDTHWFLQERSAPAKQEFFDRIASALTESGERHVLMAAHHPYRSAGPHGELLPGSDALGLEFLLKKSGTLVQDLNSPVYAEFLDRLRATFRRTSRPPLVFAGGHDHSLQVMAGQEVYDPVHVLVSGAGSKLTGVTAAPGLRYAAARPGYMTLVVRRDGAMDLFVTAGDPGRLECTGSGPELRECMSAGVDSVEIVHSETLLYPPRDERRDASEGDAEVTPGADEVPPPIGNAAVVPMARVRFGADSVTSTPGAHYPAGRIRRWIAGDLHRDLWELEFTVPVLDLDSVGGGLTVDEMSGGKQTPGLHLNAADGRVFQFRSMVKDPSRAIPDVLRETPVDHLFDDQMAAQFPLAAMVVAEILDAADILVAHPRPVVMPDDPRLGPYRAAFAGRMGWIELRPNERDGERPGFAGSTKIVGGDEVYEEIAEDPHARFDTRKVLRARLIDMLVGDWDRHSDQWRWASFPSAEGTRWEPIPRDRDWAFARMDGMLSLVSAVFLRRYVGFSDRFPPIDRLASSAYRVDHHALSTLQRADFVEEAVLLQRMLPDSVLRAAVEVLPPSYREREAQVLLDALTARRDDLLRQAVRFHDLLARTVHVHGKVGVPDVVTVETLSDGRVRVTHRVGGPEGRVALERTLDPRVTEELRVFADEEVDSVDTDSSPIRVRVLSPEEDVDRGY